MSRTRIIPYYIITLVSMALGFFLLTGCGKSSQTASSVSGTVGILLKDSPTALVTDPSDGSTLSISQLWVTINKISLQGADEGWLTVYDGTAIDPSTGSAVGPKIYDLLTLHSTADLIALADLPAGTYTKVRFELETATGANYFCTGTAVNACVTSKYDLTVPSGKVDLELNPHLTVTSGSSVDLVFDFIPDQSVKITATGGPSGKYLLRPEIHAGILGDDAFPEMALEEFEGTIESLQCGATPPTLTLSHEHGNGLKEIDLSQALIYDLAGTRITCADLTAGSRVEVKGTLQSDGTVLADAVKVREGGSDDGAGDDLTGDSDSDGSRHSGNVSGSGGLHHPKFRGTVSDLQLDGTGGATFTLVAMGGMETYPVIVGSGARIKDERTYDADLLAEVSDLADGQWIVVEGGEDASVSPAVITASEVEIKG